MAPLMSWVSISRITASTRISGEMKLCAALPPANTPISRSTKTYM